MVNALYLIAIVALVLGVVLYRFWKARKVSHRLDSDRLVPDAGRDTADDFICVSLSDGRTVAGRLGASDGVVARKR